MNKMLVVALLACVILGLGRGVEALELTPGVLYAAIAGPPPNGEGDPTDGDTLYTIDPIGGGVFIVDALFPHVTEIVYDSASGRAWGQLPNGDFEIFEFDLATGAVVPGSTHTTEGSFQGMEFVDGSLYGTHFGGSSGGVSMLATLDPTTGLSTDIGFTGFGPISGLAYDADQEVLYGIQGGRTFIADDALLLTIDMATGLATPIGLTGIAAGSLAFGPDGVLYAGGGGPNTGELYSIDPFTGAATFVLHTGIDEPISGLAFVQPIPEPATLALLGLGLAAVARRRRRK